MANTTPSKPSKTTTVLLIDNDRQEYLLIGYLLSEIPNEDYRLVWCHDTDSAFDHIEAKDCDVVLLDYHCGVSNFGQSFLIQAQAKNKHIPIIVMTDEIDNDIDQRAIREGASDYLIKCHINPQLLERAIRYAIERKQIEDRLDHLAHYDLLTDLPNRGLFLDRLHQTINIAERENKQFTLLFIDLNDFKGINDSYGHDTGDKLLKQFSKRLLNAVRRSDTVARIGGDEFTVILHNLSQAQKVMMLAQKMINDANEPYQINGNEFTVGCSIGIASYPECGKDEDTLQRSADLAMYQAKQDSVSGYRFYNATLSSDIKNQWDLLRDFRGAMNAKQFGVFYIPRLDLRNNTITAVEIAPYWKHPKRGILHYHEFSSINSDKELSHILAKWLLSVGLYQFVKLQKKQEIKLVFNFESHFFLSPSFANEIIARLKKFNLEGSAIEINLNQIIADGNLGIIESCMDNLRALGITFGMNSFGSELNALVHLQYLPINTLKLDKRFIKTVHKNSDDARLCKAIIDFAHGIDKNVVADGVKTDLQISVLKKLGCNQAKGPAAKGVLTFKQLQQLLQTENV